MRKTTMNRTIKIAYYLLEGNSYSEAAEEFSVRKDTVKCSINEYLPYINADLYLKLKNKPLMALNRMKNKGISLEEACSFFNLSMERMNLFLKKLSEKNPRLYIRYKGYIYMNTKKPV